MLELKFSRLLFASATLFVAALSLGAPDRASAGCGCDKAPPDAASIRPNATFAGMEVALFSPGFVAGAAYTVRFYPRDGSAPATQVVRAAVRRDLADAVEKVHVVGLLPDLPLGPASIAVSDAAGTVVASIPDTAFTVAPSPVAMSDIVGDHEWQGYRAAVGADGTVYVTLDLSAVTHPRIFEAQGIGYPLRFSADDVVFYNSQGFLMQLLGQNMPGLYALTTASGTADSDVLRYSRHEFNTYYLQHGEKEFHQVDSTDPNWHLDGTPHIDHDHLILAIAGDLNGVLPEPGATPPFKLAMRCFTLFEDGLVATDQVRLRNQSTTDSYHSWDDTYGAQGDILSGGLVSLMGHAIVDGSIAGATVNVGNQATVTGTVDAGVALAAPLPVDVPDNLLDLGSILRSGQSVYTLAPGSYRVADLILDDQATLHVNNGPGPVTLYVTGRFKMNDDSKVTMTAADPERFAVYVAGTETVTLSGTAGFYGVVYAPESKVRMRNYGEFFGAMVGREVELCNYARFHYDVALRGFNAANPPVAPIDPVDDSPTDPDAVDIKRSKYKFGVLTVRAVSDLAPTAVLKVSVAGSVQNVPMVFDAITGRYELIIPSPQNLDGLLLTVVSDRGGSDSETID